MMEFETARRDVWERDGYRCQECGLAVARRSGLLPNTHHVVPKAHGGGNTSDNLITLCLPCHVSKRGHEFMLAKVRADQDPQYIKWYLWEISTNLLALANAYDPRRPWSSSAMTETITGWQQALDFVKDLLKACVRDGIGAGEITVPRTFNDEQRELEEVITGLRIVWKSHHVQRALDDAIAAGESPLTTDYGVPRRENT
jgi:hypothetical protein